MERCSPFTNKIINAVMHVKPSKKTPEPTYGLKPLIESIKILMSPGPGKCALAKSNGFHYLKYKIKSRCPLNPECVKSLIHSKIYDNIDMQKATYREEPELFSTPEHNTQSEEKKTIERRKKYCKSAIGHNRFEYYLFGKEESAEAKYNIGLRSLIKDNVSTYYLLTGRSKEAAPKIEHTRRVKECATSVPRPQLCYRDELFKENAEDETFNFVDGTKKKHKKCQMIRLKRYKLQ